MRALDELKRAALDDRRLDRTTTVDAVCASPLDELLAASREVLEARRGARVDLCAIMNVKSGACSEDCRYCAQSGHWKGDCERYGLVDEEAVLTEARRVAASGVKRFAIVASGRGMAGADFRRAVRMVKTLRRETSLWVDASLGILAPGQAAELAEAGLDLYHHNLETGRAFFPSICTTHSYDERIDTIRECQAAGLSVCSGGIFGLGESWGDRYDLAVQLDDLSVRSTPLNLLTPVAGTPLAGRATLGFDEALRCLCLFRLLLPRSTLRLAGGRPLLGECQREALACCLDGLMVGAYLTTPGYGMVDDGALLDGLGKDWR